MAIISAKDLLAAGAHFGHSASRWNPKMAPYLLGKRNKIHIINLRETVRGAVSAYFFIRRVVAEGRQVLFVGTKRQAQEVIVFHSKRVEMPYVAERWLGGTLTNLATIKNRVKRLIEIETMETTGEIAKYNKKMQSAFNREKRKLKRNLEGIRTLNDLPGALFIIDPRHEASAVREAKRLGIPVVAMLDTDADPDNIDIPIAANDDAIRVIDLIVGKIANACADGVSYRKEHPEIAKQAADENYKRQLETSAIGSVTIGGR